MNGDGGNDGFLQLQGLTKRYGGTAVVDGLSLSVRRGEFVSILGPSGCGKTTTLRMVAGFVAPDGGQVLLDGSRIDTLPTHRRDATMVFQSYALFPHMSVFDNVGYGLRMRKTPAAELTRRVGEALELVRLPGFEARYPRELSGGQQQRVALARAIVVRPKLLLLDEPLSNLDAKLRKELREEFLEVHRVSGITTLFVTHDQEEAFAVSNRVAVMNRGVLEQFGPPAEIFTRPATAFVADFVGHTNLLEGPVTETAEGEVLALGSRRVLLPPRRDRRAQGRFAVPIPALAIATAPGATDNSVPAQVTRLTFLGPTIRVQLAGEGLAFVAEIPTVAHGEALEEGAMVHVGWNRRDMIELPPHGR